MPRALAPAADLVLRRRPAATLAVLLAAGVASPVDTPYGLLALIPVYGIAVHRPGRVAAAAGVALTCAELLRHLLWGSTGGVTEVVATGTLAALAVAIGLVVRERRRGAERERALLAGQAVAEERLRIARELHDAVGHDVSLMVVQAQAVGATTSDPRAKEATDAIADLGRRTMAEMHRTLRILRDDDAARGPQPSLAALDEVLDGARAAGVDVRIAMEGPARPLDPGLDASAYRIVQEAVTNVVRHAGGGPATVTVRYGPEALELLVADEGTADTGRNGGAGGHGLVGMRERVALFGGTLEAGPREDHGFAVRAVLPYPEGGAA
jgi:signal transduction histidine kinase